MSDDPEARSPAGVSLREITAATVRTVCALRVRPDQEQFVAPNALSLAQALFEPRAWYRAIYADDAPVGFVMLDVDTRAAEYTLWRFMIAAAHQRQGYGGRALELVIDYVRTLPAATELRTSYHPGAGSPAPFYIGFGFEETGELDEGERVLRLPLV